MSWLQWQLARDAARSYEQVMVSAVLLPAAEVLLGAGRAVWAAATRRPRSSSGGGSVRIPGVRA